MAWCHSAALGRAEGVHGMACRCFLAHGPRRRPCTTAWPSTPSPPAGSSCSTSCWTLSRWAQPSEWPHPGVACSCHLSNLPVALGAWLEIVLYNVFAWIPARAGLACISSSGLRGRGVGVDRSEWAPPQPAYASQSCVCSLAWVMRSAWKVCGSCVMHVQPQVGAGGGDRGAHAGLWAQRHRLLHTHTLRQHLASR